jgi:hypothetical protein
VGSKPSGVQGRTPDGPLPNEFDLGELSKACQVRLGYWATKIQKKNKTKQKQKTASVGILFFKIVPKRQSTTRPPRIALKTNPSRSFGKCKIILFSRRDDIHGHNVPSKYTPKLLE